MKKDQKLYYSIGEVGTIVDVKPHVLRYWETQFPMLKPKKNRAGNRTYTVRDIKFLLTIKNLLYEKGYTIPGARQKIRTASNNPDILIEQLAIPFADPSSRKVLLELKEHLLELRSLVGKL